MRRGRAEWRLPLFQSPHLVAHFYTTLASVVLARFTLSYQPSNLLTTLTVTQKRKKAIACTELHSRHIFIYRLDFSLAAHIVHDFRLLSRPCSRSRFRSHSRCSSRRYPLSPHLHYIIYIYLYNGKHGP